MSAIASEKMPEDVQMEVAVESASSAREDAAVEPWYISLRKSMSLPESINENGSFNLRYFQPRRAEKKRWSKAKEGVSWMSELPADATVPLPTSHRSRFLTPACSATAHSTETPGQASARVVQAWRRRL